MTKNESAISHWLLRIQSMHSYSFFLSMHFLLPIILSCLFLFSPGQPLKSQDSLFQKLTFVDYEKNVLIFRDSSSCYIPLAGKLYHLLQQDSGNVNIMHIGGSHIQAGIWTQSMQRSLNEYFPSAHVRRGLLFPYKAIETTQPNDYEVAFSGLWTGCRNAQSKCTLPLGLMGIRAETRDTAAAMKIYIKSQSKSFNRLKLFHPNDSTEFTFSFPRDPLATISYDSAGGYSLIEFSLPMDTLNMRILKTDSTQTQFTLYGFRWETDNPAIYLDAIGNNGADIPAYLGCALFDQHLLAAPPDLLILSLGINDAYTNTFNPEKYKQNYRDLIAKFRKVNPEVVVLFTTNNDSYYRRRYPNKNGMLVQQALTELALEIDAGVWDLFEIMGGYRSINLWVENQMARRDRIHFTRGGYEILGELLVKAIVDLYHNCAGEIKSGD